MFWILWGYNAYFLSSIAQHNVNWLEARETMRMSDSQGDLVRVYLIRLKRGGGIVQERQESKDISP